MKVDTFLVEEFMDAWEHKVELNIAETCVAPFKLNEFLSLVGEEDYLEKLRDLELTYGYPGGLPELKEAIAELYKDATADNILITHGAIGANFLTFFSLVEPGDTVVSVFPTYQQLYSAPKPFGAKVKLLRLKEENKWNIDLDELNELVDKKTKLIVINNPHNPTGNVVEERILKGVCEIAEDVDSYVLCDEAYYGLWLKPEYAAPSMVDICDRAIVTRSFSKSLSLTGLRLGWIVADKEVIKQMAPHRQYTILSCSILLEKLALLAVQNIEKIYERSLEIIRRNYEIMKNWVEKEPLINWIPPKGGSTAFPRYHLDMPSEELAVRLIEETGVFIVPGASFEIEGHFRVGYGNKTETIKEGLRRFSEFLEKLT